MSDFFKEAEIIKQIKAVFTFFAPIFLGAGAKLALDSRSQKLTFGYVFANMIMACFVGYIADTVATHYNMIALRGVIVSVSALLASSFVKYLVSNDTSIIVNVMKKILPSNGKEQPKNENNDTINN